jgi:hypothetical protein
MAFKRFAFVDEKTGEVRGAWGPGEVKNSMPAPTASKGETRIDVTDSPLTESALYAHRWTGSTFVPLKKDQTNG